MNCILMIDGREAIPVRAIPLLSYWENLSPDEVARALARNEGFENFADLVAYGIEAGKPKPITAVFWENFVVCEIEDLEDKELSTEQWQKKSLAALPAWTFVWRDDLVHCYHAEYGWNDDGEPAEPEIPLDFSPIMTAECESLVLECFDFLT